jgi:hypothetical protein
MASMKNPFIPTMLLLAALLASCAPETVLSPAYSLRGGLQAWVDAPLEGTLLILPISTTLVCHGSDPSGVQTLEFSLEDQVLATPTNPEPRMTLFHASQAWEPTDPGTYNIRCRAQNLNGEWSEYAIVQVSVVAMTGTITPTLTFTPTSTSTATPTPTLAALTFTSQVSTHAFEYKRDCVPSPEEVTITAILSSTAGVKSVYLFFRLESSALGVTTEWNEGSPMTSGTGGYSTTISWDEIPQLSQIQWSSAVFAYQFVVVDMGDNVLARSQVFRDVMLSPCE